ncbi:DinB family protein [Pedobacter sp.]
MKAIDKNTFITDLYQRTEVLLNEAVERYQNLKDDQLNFSMDDKSWSVAECLSHLNSYGNYYLPKLEEVLKHTNHYSNAPFRKGWLGGYFVKMMEARGKKFKAAKIHLPNVTDAYQEVAEFISQQERMLKCISAFREMDINDVSIATSVSKLVKLKVGDILAFMVAHHERHAVQIKRILAAG